MINKVAGKNGTGFIFPRATLNRHRTWDPSGYSFFLEPVNEFEKERDRNIEKNMLEISPLMFSSPTDTWLVSWLEIWRLMRELLEILNHSDLARLNGGNWATGITKLRKECGIIPYGVEYNAHDLSHETAPRWAMNFSNNYRVS